MSKDINNNLEELTDDELDRAAGGATAANAAELAKADGKTCQLPTGTYFAGTCSCAAHNKWAKYRAVKNTGIGYIYYDVKCYNCGKTWDSLDFIY